uniref:F-box domain-containing protein n=1 Tax=Aegilops tauschii subsp. strangulata TaxID=200361 RepID=A0A453TEP5_AEGTS
RATMIRRRSSSWAAVLEDDDMLGEILLRLPPQPSSLPRASAVCKRWRGIITDHGFLGRFRAHHEIQPMNHSNARNLVDTKNTNARETEKLIGFEPM